MRSLCRKLPLVVMFAMVATMFAHADIIFVDKNSPQPGEHNILFNTSTDSGTMVLGSINGISGTQAQFTATGTASGLTGSAANGQAVLLPFGTDTLLTTFSFSLTGGATFNDFIFNAGIPQGGGKPTSSTLTVTVHATDGDFTHTLTLGPGSNFLTLYTVNGESITSIDFSDPSGFASLTQPRVSFAATPEPASLLLLASGLAGLALRRRRK